MGCVISQKSFAFTNKFDGHISISTLDALSSRVTVICFAEEVTLCRGETVHQSLSERTRHEPDADIVNVVCVAELSAKKQMMEMLAESLQQVLQY